jgi:TolB-like protein
MMPLKRICSVSAPCRFWIAVILIFTVTGCQTAAPPDAEPSRSPGLPSVAVWEPDNLTPDASLSEWKEFIASAILEVFEESDKVTLVEREKLFLALEELRIGSSDLADEQTRLEIGRMIGAQWMVFGTYIIIGETLRLDLRLVDVETGRILNAAERLVSPPDLMRSLKAAREASGELLADTSL